MAAYDSTDYVCSLPGKFEKIAEAELRETEQCRELALQQMREWIAKHPKIIKSRLDANYLLRFLRKRKFATAQAFETLEQNLILRQNYSNWYTHLDVENPKIQELLDSGYAVIPKDRDELGRRILIVRPARLNPDKMTSTDVVRFLSIVFEYLLSEEITQVAGLIFVLDGSNIPIKVLNMFSLMDLKTIFTTLQDAVPIRLKEYHVVNMPSFANTVAELIIKVLSTKMQKRVFFNRNINDLKNHINPKILPKEYGGSVPTGEMICEFKESIKNYRQRILDVDKHIITNFKNSKSSYNSTSYAMKEKSISGSFRKLEID